MVAYACPWQHSGVCLCVCLCVRGGGAGAGAGVDGYSLALPVALPGRPLAALRQFLPIPSPTAPHWLCHLHPVPQKRCLEPGGGVPGVGEL